MTVLLVFLGGALGAPLRYLTDRWVQAHHVLRFPLGTLVVNLVGCFVAGVIAGGVAQAGWSSDVQTLLGTGFCGGLTTYSTFSVETIELLQGRLTIRAGSYVAVSLGIGIGLAALGWAIV
ncbi:MAG: fluoride efflux transporter CrcB [Pseudonocardiales bacterium]